ncbi:hypothetical protein CAP36_01110 [Chitinophagaceae bacterium IBVUCB2]|nr:hypothetical protein CAP36_01110 [Chitinophagaceae bacterium IBVUCB2]
MENRKYFILPIFISLLAVLSACTGKSNKEYNYIETAMLTNRDTIVPKEKKPLQIIAVSDSDAYIQAYTNFCLSNKSYDSEFQKSGSISGKPLSFKLLNKELIDISKSVTFLNKERWEKKIQEKVLAFEVKKEE